MLRGQNAVMQQCSIVQQTQWQPVWQVMVKIFITLRKNTENDNIFEAIQYGLYAQKLSGKNDSDLTTFSKLQI